MFRTKLTLASLTLAAAVGAQTAVAQATPYGPHHLPFVTDTLAPGGQPQVYRFITDTLAPGGGTSQVQAAGATAFEWGDAGIGAGAAAGITLVLLGSARLLRRRSVVAA